MRKRKSEPDNSDPMGIIWVISVLLLLSIIGSPAGQQLLMHLASIAVGIAALAFTLFLIGKAYLSYKARETERAIQIADIDTMDGHKFEQYIATLLEHQGFRTRVTKGSGDSGVDIIARKGDAIYAIQCKRSASGISRRAVSDAVAGVAHYRCTNAMVVTNNYFTPGAISLAASNRCDLVDRDVLSSWIRERQRATGTLQSRDTV